MPARDEINSIARLHGFSTRTRDHHLAIADDRQHGDQQIGKIDQMARETSRSGCHQSTARPQIHLALAHILDVKGAGNAQLFDTAADTFSGEMMSICRSGA